MNKLWAIFIIVLTTSISYALDDRRMNLLLVGVMVCAPTVFLYSMKLGKRGLWLLFLIITMIFCPLLMHPETMRWSTVFYGILYCLFFMVYEVTLKDSSVTKTDYLRLLKYLLYAYFIVLVIQQFCVLFGLPIFNGSNYVPYEKWKLNSLTSEPSHSAKLMGLLMYCYNVIYFLQKGEKVSFKEAFYENKSVWLAFGWCMITMVSASAILFLLIVLLQFVNKRVLLYVFCFLSLGITIAYHYNFKPIVRVTNIVIASSSLDEHKILEADHSGSLRILPAIQCIKQIDLNTWDGWFGKGVDYMSTIMYKNIIGVPKGYTSGGLFAFAVEYGFLPFIIMAIFSFWVCFDKDNAIISIFFWIMLVLLVGMNGQSTWACIILLYTNKVLKRKDISFMNNIRVHQL